MVGAESLRHEARQAQWASQGYGNRRWIGQLADNVGAAGSVVAACRVIAGSMARQLPLSQTTTVAGKLSACSWFQSQATACFVAAVPSARAANMMMDFMASILLNLEGPSS
jgi:hypothetical protein